jgi:IMP dehydrogenase
MWKFLMQKKRWTYIVLHAVNLGEQMKFQETLAFDDVLLVPKYSDIVSRNEIDISSKLGDITLQIPIISSPMDTVTEADMATAMSEMGGLGIIHRYNEIDAQAEMINRAIINGAVNVGAAVGITGDFIERAETMVNVGANVICVDVAHGDHISMKKALQLLRALLGTKAHIMAGNVATLEGFNHVSHWGADSVRIGIGGGSICSTRIQTGHGMPTLSSIMECAHSVHQTTTIADGGIKSSGDIVKALAAGADFVMLGSLLAGTDESPGDIIADFKIYRGMASKEAQRDWKGSYSSFEGISHKVPYRGSVKNILEDLTRNIRSGLSYSGARNISELRSKATFIKQSHAGQVESSTHIISHGR